MFCIYLRTNSDLCHLQHKLIGFYNRDEKCLLRGTDWVFNYRSLRSVFKGPIKHYEEIRSTPSHILNTLRTGRIAVILKVRPLYPRGNSPLCSLSTRLGVTQSRL